MDLRNTVILQLSLYTEAKMRAEDKTSQEEVCVGYLKQMTSRRRSLSLLPSSMLGSAQRAYLKLGSFLSLASHGLERSRARMSMCVYVEQLHGCSRSVETLPAHGSVTCCLDCCGHSTKEVLFNQLAWDWGEVCRGACVIKSYRISRATSPGTSLHVESRGSRI